MIEHPSTNRLQTTRQARVLRVLFLAFVSILSGHPLAMSASAAEPTWSRGEPDLVLTSQESFSFQARSVEQTRSFVLPLSTSKPQYVRAIEVFTGNPHIKVADSISIFRRSELDYLCDEDEGAGFSGSVTDRTLAVGRRIPLLSKESVSESRESQWAWRIDQHQVFVIELQFASIERDGVVRPSIGIYLADRPHNAPGIVWLEADPRDGKAKSPARSDARSQLTLARDTEILALFPIMSRSCQRLFVRAFDPQKQASSAFETSLEKPLTNQLVPLDRPIQLPRGTVIELLEERLQEAEPSPLDIPPRSTLAVYIHSTDEGDTLANLQRSRQNHWKAQHALCAARLEKDPQDIASQYTLGMLYAQHNETKKAVRHWLDLTAMAPKHLHAHLQLAQIYAAQKQSAQARDRYREVLKIDSGHAAANFGIANLLLAERKTSEAIAHLEFAVERDPNFAQAHMNLAILSRAARNGDKEIEHFRRAIQSQPFLMRARAALASALADQGRLEEALAELEIALSKRSTDELILFTKARLLERAEKLHDAISAYQQLLRNYPESVKGMNALAWLLATHPDPAARDVVQAIYLSQYTVEVSAGQNPQFISTLAACFAAAGRFDDAGAQVEAAIQLLPQGPRNAAIIQALMARKKQYHAQAKVSTKKRPDSTTESTTKGAEP